MILARRRAPASWLPGLALGATVVNGGPVSFWPTPRAAFGIGISASFLALSACGGAPHGNGTAGSSPSAGQTRVERRELDHHPPINLVVRLGDPKFALAFASATDQGSTAAVAVSALLLARLRAHGITDVLGTPTANGFELAVLCADPTAARAFIDQVSAALATPIADRDDALPALGEALTALRGRTFSGRAEAAVAACSGELGVNPGASVPDAKTPAGRAELEKFRKAAFAAHASAFAALGSQDFVDAAASALGRSATWPSGDEAEDPWPANDAVELDVSESARRSSIAFREPDAERALSALPALRARESDLALRLQAFAPSFGLGRLTFTARPRGACLRADLTVAPGDPGPSPADAAVAASIVSDELRAAYAASIPDRALDESIIAPADPREAAARAAARALTGRLDPGPERRLLALTVKANERASFNGFSAALNELENRPAKAALESRVRAEPGQGELWLLAGSPCGTLGESDEDAGQTALALTLAAQASSADVQLEPWLTADAVGILAHGARHPNESPTLHAARIARTLARALSESDGSGRTLTTAQNTLFSVLGEPKPGLARLLETLAPDHVAWLEPRGTRTTLSSASRDSVAARARDLLHGPLRVAVIGNEDEAQAKAAVRAFERWLAPSRNDPRRCQATAERASHGGEIALSVGGEGAAESAYIGVPFVSRLKYDREAEAIAALLNAENGRLSRALATAHVNASARASVVGGARAAALVVEIRASEDEARRAVLEVRRVLERLAQAPLSPEELTLAQRTAERETLAASLDPRRRIVDLWRGTPARPPIGASSLRNFQSALNPSAEVVVYVTHRD